MDDRHLGRKVECGNCRHLLVVPGRSSVDILADSEKDSPVFPSPPTPINTELPGGNISNIDSKSRQWLHLLLLFLIPLMPCCLCAGLPERFALWRYERDLRSRLKNATVKEVERLLGKPEKILSFVSECESFLYDGANLRDSSFCRKHTRIHIVLIHDRVEDVHCDSDEASEMDSQWVAATFGAGWAMIATLIITRYLNRSHSKKPA